MLARPSLELQQTLLVGAPAWTIQIRQPQFDARHALTQTPELLRKTRPQTLAIHREAPGNHLNFHVVLLSPFRTG